VDLCSMLQIGRHKKESQTQSIHFCQRAGVHSGNLAKNNNILWKMDLRPISKIPSKDLDFNDLFYWHATFHSTGRGVAMVAEFSKNIIFCLNCALFMPDLYPVHLLVIPMYICTSQSLLCHSYVVNEWLNRHCNVQIDIGIRADELGTN
jgi:hypothetical protein